MKIFFLALVLLSIFPGTTNLQAQRPFKQDAPGARDVTFAHAVTFAYDVQPILRRHCYRCHGSKNQEGSLQLNERAAAMGQADSDEPIIVKHDAGASLLLRRLVDEDEGDIMPLDADPLSKQEIDVLRRWIDQGAPWPDALAEAKHWAYQTIRRPRVPDVDDSPSPIDQFIRRRLPNAQPTARSGARPSAFASPRSFGADGNSAHTAAGPRVC